MSVRNAGPPPRVQPAEADVAGAAGEIEQHVRRPRVQGGDENLLPGPMDAQRHQVVHQVIARGDAVEHRAHHAGLLRAAGRGGSRNRRFGWSGLSLMAPMYSVPDPMPELPEVETVMRGLQCGWRAG